MNPDEAQSPTVKHRPAEEIRLGPIKAAIWKNDTESGVRFNVTFTRLYRQGEEWRSTESFGRDDLLLLAKVADQAHTWILTASRDSGQSQEMNRESEPLSAATLPKVPRRRRDG